jgi:hypothetical protein
MTLFFFNCVLLVSREVVVVSGDGKCNLMCRLVNNIKSTSLSNNPRWFLPDTRKKLCIPVRDRRTLSPILAPLLYSHRITPKHNKSHCFID